MANGPELKTLKAEERKAFRHRQSAYEKWVTARHRANIAYDAMQATREELYSAREKMTQERKAVERSGKNYRKVWGEYYEFRKAINEQIKPLREKEEAEYQMMRECSKSASAAYDRGNKSEARKYVAESRRHGDCCDQLDSEIDSLVLKICEARSSAEKRAPKTDSSAFHQAKEAYDTAVARYKPAQASAQAEFERRRKERDDCKAKFELAKETHATAIDRLQKKLAENRESIKKISR